MNEIILKGMIRNIEYSHTIGNVDYDKAELIVPKDNGEEDVLQLRFKKFSNRYQNLQQVELVGNLRSYSEKLDDGKNKVHLYVFTYFDIPSTDENDKEIVNGFNIDGRICKIDKLCTNSEGKQSIHFILANNIISANGKQKLNTYIPMVAFGATAIEISKKAVSDQILVHGRLNSRTYKKMLDDNEMELRTAYEGIVNSFEDIK